MPDMFGSPLGEIAAREQNLKEAVGAVNIAQMAAHAQAFEAQAAKIKQEEEASRKLAEAWNKRKTAKVEGMLSPAPTTTMRRSSADFWDAADDAASVGDFNLSRKLADTASLIDKREADESLSWMRQKKEHLAVRRNELEAVQAALRGVNDANTFEQVNEWYRETFGRPSPVAGQTYSPALMKRLASSVLTEKAQIELDLREMDTKSKMANRSDQITNRAKRLELEERRTKAQEERTSHLNKVGGKPLAGGSKQDVSAATRMILDDLFEGKLWDDLGEEEQGQVAIGATAIADEAKRLQRHNPALTRSEAIAQAYMQSKKDGDWNITKRSIWQPSTWTGGSAKFKGMGKSSAAPMPLPKKAADMIAGRFYQNAKGQVGKYLGNGQFELVAKPQPDQAAGEEDDEEEGEEE